MDGNVTVEARLSGSELIIRAVIGKVGRSSVNEVIDLCYVVLGSVISEFIDEVSGGWGGIRFPGTYVIRNVVIGSLNVKPVEGGVECLAVINCSLLPGNPCVGDRTRLIEGRIKDALSKALTEGIAYHVMNYGRKLMNLGEEVEVILSSGDVVKGEVMGYGFKGELVLATNSGVIKVRPSQVRMVRTVWP